MGKRGFHPREVPLPMDPSLDPWERQPGEAVKRYAAFTVYRDLGPQRAVRKVSRLVQKDMSLLHKWSSQDRWVARAEAWDDEVEQIRRMANLQAIEDMVTRHAKIATAVQAKIVERLQNLKPDEISAGVLAGLFDTAVRVERLSRGASTENVQNEISGKNGQPIRHSHEGFNIPADQVDLYAEALRRAIERENRPAPADDEESVDTPAADG